jgi:hypothetical protein
LPGDWEYHLQGEQYFHQVQQILDEFDPYAEDVSVEEVKAHSDAVFETCIRVLRELDEEGLFGHDAAREQLVLSLLLSDMSYEQQLEWAKRLNPESVWKRLEAELQMAASHLGQQLKAASELA